MAKIQTRRSISINGTLFARFRRFCRARGISMSAKVSELITWELSTGTVTGRISSTKPNLANRPRGEAETGRVTAVTAVTDVTRDGDRGAATLHLKTTPKPTPPKPPTRNDPFTF